MTQNLYYSVFFPQQLLLVENGRFSYQSRKNEVM